MGGPRVAALVLVAAGALAAASAAQAAQLRGTIAYGSFRSAALNGVDHYAVYLPPGYATSGKRYPVVYFLHGLPASADAYRGIGVVAAAVEQSGRQAIVVGAQGARAGDPDPEWRDWGPGRNWEAATAVELVSVVDHRYRTLAERDARVLIGVSAGGYGATLIANHYPGTYSVIESWSGYFRATDPTGTRTLDLGTSDANDWANFEKQIPLLRKRFARWFGSTYYGFYVGSNDTRFIDTNRKIYRELREYRIPHVYFAIYDGAHSWSLWKRYAPRWVGGGLGFAAKPR